MTDHVPAAAEGLSTITRRLFLRNSVSVAAVSAIGTAPVLADRSSIEESPELVRLDDEFRDAYAAYLKADKHKRAARERYEAISPALPDELICRGDFGRGLAERQVDCEGNIVWPAGNKPPLYIYSSHQIERIHGRWLNTTKRGLVKHARQMKALHGAANGIC